MKRRLAIAAALALLLAGCFGGGQTGNGADQQDDAGRASGKRVPLRVVQGEGGATLALAPVMIQGQGPFAFALDTGASQSLIDTDLAHRVGLSVGQTGRKISGVACKTQAAKTTISEWSVGDVTLSSTQILASDLPEPNNDRGLQGLLGSDVLSNFDSFTVDYQDQVLILHPKQEGQAAADNDDIETAGGDARRVKLQVVQGQRGATLALAPVTIQGQGPFPFALDTGASQSLIDRDVAQQVGVPLKSTGRKVSGVACTTKVATATLSEWRLGDVALADTQILSNDLPDPDNRQGLQGLVGSDVLSNFDRFTVDYQAEVLLLDPKG